LSKAEQLPNLPSVDQVLKEATIQSLLQPRPHRRVVAWIRDSVDGIRQQILANDSSGSDDLIRAVTSRVEQLHQQDRGQSVRRVINATGVVLHTNLGRAPLAEQAIKRVNEAMRYANVELDLHSGRRSKRAQRIGKLIAQLVDAEDAVVVNNCAAATILVLQAIAAGREVIVSRGQLVEIGGGFRLPDVFCSAGVQLREVGTTNRTYASDYQSAIGDATGALIRVHRSNFQLTGFVTEPSIDELVSLPLPEDVPVIDDLGSGCLEDLADLGLNEPTVRTSVAAGADLTLFSGDKLFGGPQCGIIVGRARWIERLRHSPMMRAMRIDKMTLAALEVTVDLHYSDQSRSELPVLRMLAEPSEAVRQRCERVRRHIDTDSPIDIVACQSPVGGGSVPGATRPSYAIKISGRHIDRIASQLRGGDPAIQGRVADDSLLLDLRTVANDEVEMLIGRLQHVLQSPGEGRHR